MNQSGNSKISSEFPMAFPPYRPSHFRSQTYNTLVCILTHLSPSTVPTQPLNLPDNNGNVGMGQEKEPECSELKVGSDVKDPKGPVPLEDTIGSVGDKDKDLSATAMVLDDIQFLMGSEEPSTQTNDFQCEQKLMDELELVMKGIEDPVCDNCLIPLNCEKQNSGSEVDLMDYQVEEHVEFLQSGTNTSESVSEVLTQVQGEHNELASEGFHVLESTKEHTSNSVISTSRIENDSQQKETELVNPASPVAVSLPTIQEDEFEKEEQDGHKVVEETHSSLDLDTNIEALNMAEDGGLLDSSIMKDKFETENEEKSDKLICVRNTTNSSDILIEGDLEEGEISGYFAMDENTFDVSSADDIVSEQMKVDEIQKAGNSFGNTIPPLNMGLSFQGFPSNLLTVNAIQDSNSNGQVQPRTINAIPTNLTQNQVLHKGFMEETAIKYHKNSSAAAQQMADASRKEQSSPGPKKKKNKKEVLDASRKRKHVPDSEKEDGIKEDENKQMVDASGRKRGPGSQEKKTRKKEKYRNNRAKKNRELGVKKLKFIPVQKQKIVTFCRHYMQGRCNEGDKCNFSHDTVPSTKSKPCFHFARHSCMKGDDCPYDHQLSKYPCSNFVSKGSCSRGNACMFSHKVPTNQDMPTPTNACKPELKSPLSLGNTNFSTPLNNHGNSSVQRNHFTNSKGIYSHTNVEHKVTDTSQTKPTSVPKGIRFINVANISPSTPKQDTVTPNKGSVGSTGTCADKGQNTVEVPKKFPAATPKGINFLSFGKSSVCSFKSSIQSTTEGKILKLPQSVNFGLSEHSISSLNKDDYGKASDRTAESLPQTALFSHDILDKNQSMADRMKSKFLRKDSTDDSVRDHGHCKSVLEGKKASDNSQTSTVTSATLLARPFASQQSSDGVLSGYHKQASNLGQRALLSTLAFAAEHESGIKMKCPTGVSPV
ncbi:uncharacterized protein LOC123918975 isoform X2 [Trifolium pratense]|uniref:uncharacterized protein LOC123918975 isoform X2 n=1 Tax=Trifolium pratense TaxID=57577 RepID=UPI001E6949BF|nr:uncharacterized protein LOC123918975 isoform X2 [Trifolium pratense]XP_045827137.1 uncharacterized protein LOC123918975 isoform X2 [Trifolium pratense]XP_045827138.1 uncharacterized protein LOC123918975 isoform X2 [Trifolium pratense]